MRTTFYLLLLLLLSSCAKDLPELESALSEEFRTSIPGVKAAGPFISRFTQFGPGWTGGDGAASIPLPDGTVLWIFGDSFIGTLAADRSRPPGSNVFIRNSAVRTTNTGFETIIQGTVGSPDSWLKPPETTYWYWPQHGIVKGAVLYVWCITMRSTGTGGPFGFEYVRTDIVRVDLTTLAQIDRIAYPSAGKLYGNSVMESGDWIYVYGSKERPAGKQMVVSRIPAGSEPGTVAPTFWDGTSWSANPMDVLPMLDDLSNLFTVFPDPGGSGFRLVCQNDYLSDQVHGWTSPSPEGPFGDKTFLFATPQTGGDIFTYNATAHPEFTKPDGTILVSYSNNSFNFGDLFTDADNYRPWFAWVPLW